MPKIEQTIADVNVRSHTFRFITPEMTDQLKIPNPCTGCHTGHTDGLGTKSFEGMVRAVALASALINAVRLTEAATRALRSCHSTAG